MRYLLLSTYLLLIVTARVTFPNAEVLQAPDLGIGNQATFKCKNQCRVYADRKNDKLYVTQKGNVIANFNSIVGGNIYSPAGFLLEAGDDYILENRGDPNPEFVFYIVDTKAPNYGAPMYTPTEKMGVAVKNTQRYFTVLSSYEAMWFSGFTGNYPDGYPRIYATGFDSAGDAQCHPAFQARSQKNAENSWPSIATAVFTVDFGFIGDHNVSVNSRKAADPSKAAGMSTVYTSPGYVGCAFIVDQNYHSSLSRVNDAFAISAERLDINALYYSVAPAEAVHFKVNDKVVDLVGTSAYSTSYGKGTFDVELSWIRQTPGSSFAIQLDFGSTSDPPISTTTKSSRSFNVLHAFALLSVAFLWARM